MRRVLAGLIAVVCIATGALVVACGGATETLYAPTNSPGQLLAGVPNSDIDGSSNSDKFEPAPADASPQVSADSAKQTVLANAQGAEIQEMALLNYTSLVKEPPDPPTLVWVGNLKPETFPAFQSGPACGLAECPPRGQAHTVYAYVVINATTGEFMHTAASSYVDTPTPTPTP